ncbi:MAG TPA: hypothetical protein VH300_02315 [Thermoleophilaceae bacterium]|jgi:hypothetical protein|nr:hypothetical protein [Thermoleophilaceae bacterium]
MADTAPEFIDVRRHRDWEGRTYERWLPNVLFGLICIIPLLALFNVFGQAPEVKKVVNPNGMASLELSAPTKVRSGLLFQARFDIRAIREIKDAVLVLDSGWLESITMNTAEPAAQNETSRNGGIAFDLGNIPAGKLWREYLEFQVNPVNSGSQSQGVTLYDGNVPLLHLNRTLKVWP